MFEWVPGRGQELLTCRTLHRFIKRKKFDDELVESSLAKSSTRAKGASGVEPGRCSGSEPSSSEKKKVKDWEILGGGEGDGVQHQILFLHSLCQLSRILQRMLIRGPNCPTLNLRCLPPRSPSLPTPPYLLHPHPVSASCITFCVGGMERASILGADSLFPALLGVKITPRWHCSGPRHCTSKSVFLVSILPLTLHPMVGGATSKEKTPYGQGLCRSALVGAGIRKLSFLPVCLLLAGAATQYVKL